jgi:hypothetical protein
MTRTNNLTSQPIHSSSLAKRMLFGAGIALILIAIFLLLVNNPKPEWGELWMIRPLTIVPLAGAMGGLFYYSMDHLRYQGGWKMILAYILSLIVYLFVLWIGTILGLSGTLWN